MSNEERKPKVFHYAARVAVEILCSETGKETHAHFGTDYHSGEVEPDRKTLIKKILRKTISEFQEAKP